MPARLYTKKSIRNFGLPRLQQFSSARRYFLEVLSLCIRLSAMATLPRQQLPVQTPFPRILDSCAVLRQSNRIINAHSRHFLVLSFVFLLPLSFSVVVFPALQQLLTNPFLHNSLTLLRQNFVEYDDVIPISRNALMVTLAYVIFILVVSHCAVGAITYSVFHGFYGRPVKLVSAMRSIFSSFIRLLVTSVMAQLLVCLIVFGFGFSSILVIRGVEFLGFQIDYSSPCFVVFSVVLVVVVMVLLVYLQVSWTLVPVIVVVESNWGYDPLRRSSNLIKGMRRVAVSLLLIFGVFSGILIWQSQVALVSSDDTSNDWKNWGFVMQIVGGSILLMLLLLYNIAANTVLYMYCKAVHGELAMEIAEEFAAEYVRLPFDDGKVPHVVSVVHV